MKKQKDDSIGNRMNGVCLYKNVVMRDVEYFHDGVDRRVKVERTAIKEDWDIPVFTQDRACVEKWI
jgi:hypothetical protein